MPKTRTSAAAGGGGGVQLATGSYTGDGAATQAIVGVGFQPTFILIYWQSNGGNSCVAFKTSSNVADWGSLFAAALVGSYYLQDMIVSLDANGFTVGDGTGFANILNIGAIVYSYVCMA